MAQIKAFKAIRPTRDKVHLVATKPVYTYKKTVLAAKLESNPYTFIRIINPEYKELIKTEANSRERFLNVKAEFDSFCEKGILFQDQEAHVYLYRQTKGEDEYVGIIAGASVEEYLQDRIKKHEATLTSRENIFTEYLDVVGFNAEPVLLAYPHHPELENLYSVLMQDRPEYEYSTTDTIKHEVWLIKGKDAERITSLFAGIENTYIADGHHRCASSARLAEKYNAPGSGITTKNHDFFLAYLMDEKRIKILEFNRLVHRIGSISEADFLEELKKKFKVKALSEAREPEHEHQFTMNSKNNWYLLEYQAERIDHTHPVECLDPEILTREILSPLLGIHDLKTDTNIEFVSGNLGLQAITDAIVENRAELGFVLYPLNMEQLKVVADNHLIMPPKSTWVEPKLRSGLTIYNIRE